jgi:hypothetical protein
VRRAACCSACPRVRRAMTPSCLAHDRRRIVAQAESSVKSSLMYRFHWNTADEVPVPSFGSLATFDAVRGSYSPFVSPLPVVPCVDPVLLWPPHRSLPG